MRPLLFLTTILVALVACNPYRALRPRTLDMSRGDTTVRIRVLVPRGGSLRTEEAGGARSYVYSYRNGASLFFHPHYRFAGSGLDTSLHIGKAQLGGGLFYKVQTEDERFQRDVLRFPIWFGYRKADEGKQAALLDSALNSVRRER